jgi:hypothetical protein
MRASARRSNTTSPRRGKFYRSAIKSVGYQKKTPTGLSIRLRMIKPNSSGHLHEND